MRYLLLVLAIEFSLFAQSLTIGGGPYIQTQPYKDVSPIVVPSPVIFYDNGILYVRWTRVGLYFMGQKKENFSWGFSLTAQPRPYGYRAEDSFTLKGMDERKNSWEGGIAFSMKYDKSYLEIIGVTDLLYEKDAKLYKCEIGTEFKLGEFSFYPSFLAVFNSSSFNNYYYGVKQNEVISDRTLYVPNSAMQYAMQSYIEYPFTEKLSLFANIKADLLPQEVTNSPIVDDGYIYSGILSLIYTFKY